MTNSLAVYLGILIIAALGVDYALFDWGYYIFWIKKLMELTEYIAFWR